MRAEPWKKGDFPKTRISLFYLCTYSSMYLFPQHPLKYYFEVQLCDRQLCHCLAFISICPMLAERVAALAPKSLPGTSD